MRTQSRNTMSRSILGYHSPVHIGPPRIAHFSVYKEIGLIEEVMDLPNYGPN